MRLDGAHLEGGGALVRVALALSTLTGQKIVVENIRAARPNPGLKAQHLAAINALKEIANAKTNKIELGSDTLIFEPGKVKGGKYKIDIGTAGSITLLLQALIPPCLFASSRVELIIKGGTCGKWQASVDYLQNVLLPHLQRFAKIELKVIKRGYYPKGGGEICLIIRPKYKLKDFSLLWKELEEEVVKYELIEVGNLEQIKGIVNCSAELVDSEVGNRILMSAKKALQKLDVPVNIRVDYTKTKSIGGEFLLWTVYSKNGDAVGPNKVILAFSTLIEKGIRSEEIGIKTAKKLIDEIKLGFGCDEYLADQLIPYMVLLPGSVITTSKITNHTKTNIHVVEQFLPVSFEIERNKIKVKKTC